MSTAATIEHRELAVLDSLVTSIAETRAAIAALQALELTFLAAAEALAEEQTVRLTSGDSRAREMPRRSIAAEIGTATRTSDRTVQRRMGEASVLTGDFPLTIRALGTGRIDRAHVGVILETGGMMTDAAARGDFETAAIALAERETPGRLRPLLRTLAARLDPTSIDVRHAEARTGRGVWVVDLDDGMAQLIATLPAAIAHAIRDRLTRFAHTVIDARPAAGSPVVPDAGLRAPAALALRDPSDDGAATGGADHRTGEADHRTGEADLGTAEADRGTVEADRRTIEQLRADVLADLLLAADPTAAPRSPEPITAVVQVVVPVLTLLGDRDGTGASDGDGPAGSVGPAELVGRAPIDTATARHLAGSAPGWDRILTHPITGTVLAVDRYRPSQQQRRHLRARDERCRFPGCRMPVHRCDIDHTTDAALGGATSPCNLAHLCRRHHTLKHATDWTVTQHPDGTLEWTSPTGRVHLDEPPSSVRFRASTDPPPF